MPNSKLSISLEREKKFAKKSLPKKSAKKNLPKKVAKKSLPKKNWWRCRELNPGPNNKEDSFLQV